MAKAVIISNSETAPSFWRMRLGVKTGAVEPGQFVMLKVTGCLDPLLRRPFSVYDADTGRTLELLYKVVGRGTSVMAGLKPGDEVDVLGPLGNSFPSPSNPPGAAAKAFANRIVMVAGGIGIAPFYLYARRFKKFAPSMRLLYGARAMTDAVLPKAFKKEGVDVRISTEDGSVGKKGRVTGMLADELAGASMVLACGPMGMLKETARIAAGCGVKAFVSLERSMACGIGVCLGCAVKTSVHAPSRQGYAMVCSDGPVFDSRDVAWEKL